MKRTAPFVRPPASFVALGLAALGGCSGDPTPPATSPTLVLISIDTLRPERLGVYGNTPDVSPTLDAFAKEAVVFDDALSVSPWTLPAHMSMLTGLDPVAHGVRWANNRLSSRATTLADLLAARGYATAAFADGGFVGTGWGLERGFGSFDSAHRDEQQRTGFARYLASALGWLKKQDGKPLFLFLHSFDVHAPYDECRPEVLERFRSRPVKDGALDHELYKGEHTQIAQEMRFTQYKRMGELLNDYDAGVHEADLAVAEVFRALRESGRWDDALIVVTSDHGESFYDQRLWVGHGVALTDDEIRIPLIVKFPKGEGAGQRRQTLVDLVDVAPTVLDAAGLPPGPQMQGSSLRELVRGKPRSRSYVFGHTVHGERFFLARAGLKYISGTPLGPFNIVRPHLEPRTPDVLSERLPGGEFRRKLAGGGERVSLYSEAGDPFGFADTIATRERLFDRRADPAETIDLAPSRPEDARKLATALFRIEQQSSHIASKLTDDAGPRAMTKHEQLQLQALGYLAAGDDESDPSSSKPTVEPFKEAPRPDMTPLFTVDPTIHRARLAVAAGRGLSSDARAELESVCRSVADWGEANPYHHFRAEWRILEIEKISLDAGVPIDVKGELGRVMRAAAKELATERALSAPDEQRRIEEERAAQREERRRQRRNRDPKQPEDNSDDDSKGREDSPSSDASQEHDGN